MGQCVSGVSGGLAVGPTPTNPTASPQLGGVTLSQAGDYAVIFINNGAPPGGPDISGIFALSGSFIGPQINVLFVPDATNWTNGNWQTLNGVTRNDTNAPTGGAFVPPSQTALQLNPGNVSALYAIRVLMATTPTSGTMLVSGNTNPGSVAGVDAAILAQIVVQNTLIKAQVLALSDLNSTDYLAAVGGSF